MAKRHRPAECTQGSARRKRAPLVISGALLVISGPVSGFAGSSLVVADAAAAFEAPEHARFRRAAPALTVRRPAGYAIPGRGWTGVGPVLARWHSLVAGREWGATGPASGPRCPISAGCRANCGAIFHGEDTQGARQCGVHRRQRRQGETVPDGPLAWRLEDGVLWQRLAGDDVARNERLLG